MTPAEAWETGLLVRVVAPDFVAGLLLDPATQRVIVAAPILAHLRGQHRDKLRQTFARLGWRATIVPRRLVAAPFDIDAIHAERLAAMRKREQEIIPVPSFPPTVHGGAGRHRRDYDDDDDDEEAA